MAPLLHDRPPDSGAPHAASADVGSEAHEAGEAEGSGGGDAVTGRARSGTSGGAGGMNGWTPLRVIVVGNAIWIALVLIQASVNAMSQAAENPASPSWPFWVWEGSSVVGWLCVAPLLWQLVRRLPRLARRPVLLVAVLAAAVVALSLVHVAIMFGLRFAIYPLIGETYRPYGDAGGIFVYEFRKDVSTLLQMGLGLYLIQ